jgi:hypothetical protein
MTLIIDATLRLFKGRPSDARASGGTWRSSVMAAAGCRLHLEIVGDGGGRVPAGSTSHRAGQAW